MTKALSITRPKHEYDKLCKLYRREKDARLKQRMAGILARWEGVPVKDIARQQRVSRVTVRNWVKRFNEEGIDGLSDKPRSGRPRKIDWERLREVLFQSPEKVGYPVQGWNRDLLLDYIKRTYGVSYHPQHIYWIIRRLGFRSLVPRPRSYAANEEEVEEWKKMWEPS